MCLFSDSVPLCSTLQEQHASHQAHANNRLQEQIAELTRQLQCECRESLLSKTLLVDHSCIMRLSTLVYAALI